MRTSQLTPQTSSTKIVTTRLGTLINNGSLERAPVDGRACINLLKQARRHVDEAEDTPTLGDLSCSFQLAYTACLKTCLALVLASGLRPRDGSTHTVTFEAAAEIGNNFGARAMITAAGELRHIKHQPDDDRHTMLHDSIHAIRIANRLLSELVPRIHQIRP